MPNGSSVASPGGQAGAATWPVLSVLRGEPTEAELAAVITVLAARSAAAARASAGTGKRESFDLVRKIPAAQGAPGTRPRRVAAQRPSALARRALT